MMTVRHDPKTGFFVQFWHFVLHLRLHYQFFILSGAYLMGALLAEDLNVSSFLVQFLNIHVLLFGGATAYNSFWDRDEGPIGGLRNPPEMKPWMWGASWFLQLLGLALALPVGFFFVGLYGISIVLFWLYSSPWARWKGRPVKSLFAIGISTGFNAVLMGFVAAGGYVPNFVVGICAVGVMLLLLSLYPLSQVYQQKEDRSRGDYTFAIKYKKAGVVQFFKMTFLMGLVLVAVALSIQYERLGILFSLSAAIIGGIVNKKINVLFATESNRYKRVMAVKYGTSIAFVLFLTGALILKHTVFLPAFTEWLFK